MQCAHPETLNLNAMCCAGGRKVLRVIDNEGIQANAHAVRCVHAATANLTPYNHQNSSPRCASTADRVALKVLCAMSAL